MNDLERKNTNRLVKIAFLEDKSLDVIIDTLDKQNVIFGMNKLHNSIKKEIKEYFQSDEFISRCAARFSHFFTSEEISLLLSMYASDVMKKFKNHTEEAWNQLYLDMKQEVHNRAAPSIVNAETT